MAQVILLVALDLGTATTTARFSRVRDTHDSSGNVHRQTIGGSPVEMKNWPGGYKDDAIGKACLPTELIYDRVTGDLLFWGFEAHQYLEDPTPEISLEQVLVVQHIKLLLNDPDKAKLQTPAVSRYRKLRGEISTVLKKTPFDLFQDFLDVVLDEVVRKAKRYYHNFIPSQVEVTLAFPSGWPDTIHREVAAIGARAMTKALATNELDNVVFAIENVYTVSETLCGVKEWLTATINEEDDSIDLQEQPRNIHELDVGDSFIAADIGGGTGCMTVLKLISKDPLQVDQIGQTQSLEVSGEAVEAEFERELRLMILAEDIDEDLEQLISRICRSFKEEKKVCSPRLGNSTWNLTVPRIRPNPAKGFHRDVIKFDRKLLDRCFDPAIDTLEAAIEVTLKERPEIKAIIFLGQFGSSSTYLKKRMARSPIAAAVKLRYSHTGKMDVVKGALAERQQLREKFIRKSETVKSYGTLVTLPWGKGLEGTKRFPNAIADGAVNAEKHLDGLWLKVIEWVIPKGTVLEGERCDVGLGGRRNHFWESGEKEIGFEDIIIVSDEVPPYKDGKSYTLWTHAHEDNKLVINGERIEVQKIFFSWDLSKSQKLSPSGESLGPYSISDLVSKRVNIPRRKGSRGCKYVRILHYDLVWDITEMQVKTHVKAIFARPVGPLSMQLAKQRTITADEKSGGESRSIGLERDIMITEAAEDTLPSPGASDDQAEDHSEVNNVIRQSRDTSTDNFLGNRRLIEELARAHPHRSPRTPNQASPGAQLHNGSSNLSNFDDSVVLRSWRMVPRSRSASRGRMPRQDGRRREGCYTCKNRKKKCDSEYSHHETNGNLTCNECDRQGIVCLLEKPEWADDPEQLKSSQEERRRLIRLGKRKSRDVEGNASGSSTRQVNNEREQVISHEDGSESPGRGGVIRPPKSPSGNTPQRRVLGKGKAIRGGLSRRF